MTRDRLDELISRPAPGEHEAGARGYEVARAAFEQRSPVARRSARLLPALAAALVVAIAVTVALTPAGGAIADLIEERLGGEARDGERSAAPGLTSLPGGGELIVVSERGPWVVRADGSQRLLGDYDDASWSPGGLFAVASDGRQLTALELSGEPRWSLVSEAPVSGARWSPSPGFHVAYLSSDSLRVVQGDGTGDALLAESVAPTPPAWLPLAGEAVLAFADRAGRVVVHDVVRDRMLWRSPPGEEPVQLAWSAGGDRLLAVGRRAVRIFDGEGRSLGRIELPAGAPAPAVAGGQLAAFAERGHRFALVRSSRLPGQSEVVLLRAERHPGAPRELFAGPGSFSEVAWAPDGRTLLVGWPSADQLLFLRPDRPRGVKAVSSVARQFSPGRGAAAGFPRISDWCCAP